MNTEVTKKVIPSLFGSIKEIPQVDTTLTKEGRSADAKVVGDILADHKRRIDNIDPHFAENVEYDNENSGLNAANVQGALDEVSKETNDSSKRAEKLVSGTLETAYDIDTTKYRFIYYELRTNAGLCMISNIIPTAIITSVVQEFNHTEYVSSNYNAEMTVQIKRESIKVYKKALSGWNLSSFNVYGIY